MSSKAVEISSIIKEQIKQYENKIEMKENGTVITVGDGIATVYGLRACMANELLRFEDGSFGVAQNLEEETVSVAILSERDTVREGSVVYRTGEALSVPVGEALLGRVVNALGAPIDGKGPVETSQIRPVESPAPGIIQRKSVSVPLQTGIKAIDSMIPIGRGQRELIIGDRQTGKTTIAIDTIINQKGKNEICIYVAIGQRRTSVVQIAQELEKAGALYDYRFRFRGGERAAAVHRSLFRMRHGGVFPGTRKGCPDRLRRPEQARGSLPRPESADPPASGTRSLPRRRILPPQPPAGARGMRSARIRRRFHYCPADH